MRKMMMPLLLAGFFCVTQSQAQERVFSRKELEADLDYLQQQLHDVHADPHRELTAAQWHKLFATMRSQLKDSMTAAAFFSITKPAVSFLSDEHADISAPVYFEKNAVFLPFSLRANGNGFVVDSVVAGNALQKGDRVSAVNGVPVAQLVKDLQSFTTGFADERGSKTPEQFGYLYGFAHPYEKQWKVTVADGKEISLLPASLKQWTGYLKLRYGAGGSEQRKMSYDKYGSTGYIIVPHFAVRGDNGMQNWKTAVDSLFVLVERDGVTKLVIDVSQNSGGNSAVGTLFIDHFYSKPYRTYGMGWRRSEEYLKLIKSWGVDQPEYQALKPGTTLHRGGDKETPSQETPKFRGKVYVAVGNGTFSSAIMFATIVKDNKMATLIGQVPRLGHPSHFGEMYGTKLPNTQLPLRFGVKEWIRPNGNKEQNILKPDIILEEVKPETVVRKIG